MMTEPQYRNFDDLLDSVKIDMKTFDVENLFDAQQFIKIAIRINYELGLKVNPTRSKCLTISKGRVRLPEDFYKMNYALVCNPKNNYSGDTVISVERSHFEGMLEGVTLAQKLLDANHVNQEVIFTDIEPGSNIITHGLKTQNVVVQAYGADGNILSFIVNTPDLTQVVITSEAETTITNVKIILIGAKGSTTVSSAEVYSDDSGNIVVQQYVANQNVKTYDRVYKLRMKRHKGIIPESFSLSCNSDYTGEIKDNFLLTNFDEGTLFINYQSLMEDDFGNLIVFDHPLVNEYYEYAIKQRLLENLYMSGENTVNQLQLIEQRLRAARNNALSFINTPDFKDMQKMWELNRKVMYNRYYDMFRS